MVLRNALFSEDEIRSAFESQILSRRDWAYAHIVEPKSGEIYEDQNFRQARIHKLDPGLVASEEWLARIETAVLEADDFFFHEKIQPHPSEINLNYYQSPNDFFGWHRDSGAGHTVSRRLSAIVMLWTSPDLLGGDFEIDDSGIKTVPLVAGDILVFRTDLQHQVTPLISGERVTLNLWWRAE